MREREGDELAAVATDRSPTPGSRPSPVLKTISPFYRRTTGGPPRPRRRSWRRPRAARRRVISRPRSQGQASARGRRRRRRRPLSRTRPRSVAPGEAGVRRARLVAALPHDPVRVEVDEAEVRRRRRPRCAASAGPERPAPAVMRSTSVPGRGRRAPRARVERREGGLQPGGAHRRLLEGDLLLLARVRRVVGGDAVDRARRAGPSMSARRSASARSGGFIFRPRVERADRLVGEA